MIGTFSRKKLHGKRAANPCFETAFYTSPKSGTAISTSQPLTLSWNTSSVFATCLGNAPKIDIYLTSPDIADGQIKAFSPITFADGTYTHTLDPKWWNGTKNSNIQLHVNIIPSGTRLFLSPIAAGPVLNVTVDTTTTPTNNTTSADPNLSNGNGAALSGGLPKGSVAAAVLLPIIVIILAVLAYVKISRKKQAEKRKRWSQALDARMSRISGDWQSMSAKGAQTALRDSTMRMSTVFAQEMQMRPSFSRSASGERMSVADRLSVAALSSRPSVDTVASHYTTNTNARNTTVGVGERTSRISFAADVNASRERLSTYSTGRASRAFHVGAVPEVPPVPAVPIRSSSYENAMNRSSSAPDVYMSPTQTDGPVVLSNEDIHNIDIAPALSLMRTGTNPAAASSDDLLLSPPGTYGNNHSNSYPITASQSVPLSPLGASSFAPPLSPLGSGMGMMMPLAPQSGTSPYMSPDELLKRYAEMRANGAKSPTISIPGAVYSPSFGMPSTPGFGNGMPTTPGSAGTVATFTGAGMRNLTGSGVPSTAGSYTAAGMRNLTGDERLNVGHGHNGEDAYFPSQYGDGQH